MSSEPNERAPVGAVPPQMPLDCTPPKEPGQAGPSRSSLAPLLVVILNVFVLLFMLSAVLSLLDATLVLGLGSHAFTAFGDIVSFLAIVAAVGIYGLMGLTPMIPKRWFLPLTLFFLTAFLVCTPLSLFCMDHVSLIGWLTSLCQVAIGALIYRAILGGAKFRWMPVTVAQLGNRAFSGRNLLVFLLANIFVLAPSILLYLFAGTATAVSHFSEGFMALHPGGLSVQVRKYVRDDGKVIELFPMAHVADGDFYQHVAETFPTNSIILMEGVTDEHHLLTNKISYARMAKALGLSEQHHEFIPTRGRTLRADIDVDEFSTNTISLLNLAMLFHAQGMTPEVSHQLMDFSPPPDFEENLFGDLVGKRNQHLLTVIQTNLPLSDNIMVPWGAAHMPGIAREIQKVGFHLQETHDYMVIKFGGRR